MTSQETIERLEAKGIKPTANRILIYRALAATSIPMSLKNLEMQLLDIDRSSIFRTLTLFLEHDVVHSFEDGRGVLNYELCNEKGECHNHDTHPHFYCESCQRSFCIEDAKIPHINLPEGFCAHSISLVIKGECPECKMRHKTN